MPWNIYSMFSIVAIAGLTHVPHAYLYIRAAQRRFGCGRSGANGWRIAAAGHDLGEPADGAGRPYSMPAYLLFFSARKSSA